MTITHHTTAEIARLTAVLGLADTAELDFLAELPPAALREFRTQITDLIHHREARRMQRVAAAAKLVPAALAGRIAEAAIGSVLAAAVAGSVEPQRAVAIAAAVSPTFLADIAVTLDPRRAAQVIAEIPDAMAVEVARELLARGDYLTMGRLAGSVPERVLRVALPHAADIDLLHVGYHLEDTAAADRLLATITDRVPGLIHATDAERRWPEAIALLDLLGPVERSRLGDVVADQDAEVLDGLLATVVELDAWRTLLPVAARMQPPGLRRLAQRPIMSEPAVLTAIADLALTQDLWLDLLPLADHLSPAQLHTVAARVAAESDEALTALIEQTHAENYWNTLLPVALALAEPERLRLATLPVMHRRDTLSAAIATAAAHDLWASALPLVDVLPTHTHDVLAASVGDLTDEEFLAAVHAGPAAEATTTLVRIVLRQSPPARARSMALLEKSPDLAALVESFTTDDPAVWDNLADLRDEIPASVRILLSAQATRCDRPDIADRLAA
ncbi:hypothetical protein [Nocardia lasii]|uniref:DUF2336 domain-containing protein n=1 Tax=Nocardia lasii TaxID=1616107 RepID=A0ABW1K0D8_9NOCA